MTLVGAWVPSPALACSVCFWGKSNSMVAYVGTAVLLSLLPLALLGGIAVWIRRQVRAGGRPPRGRST